jgi:hypothetical protein
MVQGYEVLQHLLPAGGWVISGDTYEGIQFLESETITKSQFQAGFAQVEALKTQQAENKSAAKIALLDKLGITEDEAKLLLS